VFRDAGGGRARSAGYEPLRWRASMAQIRQSRPGSCLNFQVHVIYNGRACRSGYEPFNLET